MTYLDFPSIALLPQRLILFKSLRPNRDIKSDLMLSDLNTAIEEATANAGDVCQSYTSKTGTYNQAVNACSRAKKKTVTLS